MRVAASTCSKIRNTGLRLSSTCLVRIAIACLFVAGRYRARFLLLMIVCTIPDSIEQTFLDEQLKTLPLPADTAWKDQHSLIWIASFDENVISKECKASLLRRFFGHRPSDVWTNLKNYLSPDEASYIDEQVKKLEQRAGTQPPTLHQAVLLIYTSRHIIISCCCCCCCYCTYR